VRGTENLEDKRKLQINNKRNC